MVKQGYKQTEIGVIPEDWEVKSVKDLTSFHKQGYYTKEQYKTNGAYYLLRGTDMQNPKIDLTTTPRLDVSDNDFNSYKVLKNDVLIVRSGAIGRYGINKEENANFVFGSYLINFRFKNELVPEYFGRFYESDYSLSQINAITQGGANLNINAENIKSLQIPLPPLAEQEAIASALSDADAWIESLEKLIAKKRLIKQGAMQELLTPPDGTVSGVEPWEVKKLGEVSSSYSGGTPNTANDEYYNGEINFIGSGDLNQSIIRNVEGKITEQGLINSSAKMIDPDTLLIAMYGATAGVVAISKIRGAINQAVLAVLPIKGYLTEFIYYFFTLKKDWIIKTYTQGGQPNLSGGILKNIEIPFPPLSEQERIATILSDMDAEIEALEQKLSKARQIKQGMMQELLTGRTRLIDN